MRPVPERTNSNLPLARGHVHQSEVAVLVRQDPAAKLGDLYRGVRDRLARTGSAHRPPHCRRLREEKQ
jgi:hypothetical protein